MTSSSSNIMTKSFLLSVLSVSVSSSRGQEFEARVGRCRDTSGFRGSLRSGEFDLFGPVTHETCKSNCLGSSECFGYEYSEVHNGRCEVWKVPIGKSQPDSINGVDCFIKDKTQPLSPSESCFTVSTYDSIDNDIEDLKNEIRDIETRSHFLGGIVMLAAHDFMDFDQNSDSSPFGPDGCFDEDHPTNVGLSETTWCSTCELTLLYEDKYSHLSRADFWIAAAHAVIRQTSVGNVLDMKDTFLWGRIDMDSCPGSGDRLPIASGCDQTEAVFLERMGLEWRDAVALMGGHTLGRGTQHQGTWVGDDQETQVFDKRYYEEIFDKTWWPRNDVIPAFDWVTTRGNSVEGLMLNTDICLAFDIEEVESGESPCCTELTSECTGPASRGRTCPMAHMHGSREVVEEMLGRGAHPHPNAPFYNAFTEAWRKATTVGQDNLSPLVESCDSLFE